jgi:hypothetical protein
VITRLVGGLTPGDGSDPRTFPAIWNDTADTIDALRTGYVFVGTIYFTSSGTFTKATYPWLRAIRVKCQGSGGGGGSAATTSAGQVSGGGPGSGGAYAESFITDIAGLDASITVTRPAGGAGGLGSSGGVVGSDGGTASFGSLVSAGGGNGGAAPSTGAVPRTASARAGQTAGTGDLIIPGGSSYAIPIPGASFPHSSNGGDAFLGAGGIGRFTGTGAAGTVGTGFGAGGSGGLNAENQATARNGGAGAPGIVIVELYA